MTFLIPKSVSWMPFLALGLVASQAQAGNITNATVSRNSTFMTISWNDNDAVDVFLSDRPDAALETATLISAKDNDGKHELTVASNIRPYVILRDNRDGQVVHVAERVIPLERGSNFRDIGGYPAAGGKHVRWGMIYRSGGTPLLTQSDVRFVQGLGIRNLIDLRSDEERVIAPTRLDGIAYHAVGYSMTDLFAGNKSSAMPSNGGHVYRNLPTMLTPQIRLLFDTLLDRKSGPVAFNCSAGQDRTGFTAALVLSALGVSRDVILQDYHLSTAVRQPINEMPTIDPVVHAKNPIALYFAKFQKEPNARPSPLKDADGKAFLSYAFEEIEARWGSVDAYLEKEIGVGAAEITKLRTAYLQ